MSIIDVIIPIYNGEKFLNDIFTSLCDQTFKDFRAIFVNDGSKDNTYNMLVDMCKKVPFETLIVSQENKGLPGARNSGIRNSTADWIAFLDVDDYPLPEYLEYLYTVAQKTNVNFVYGNYKAQNADLPNQINTAGTEVIYDVLSASDVLIEHFNTKWIAVWTLLINRNWLYDKGFLFDEKCVLLEDNAFLTTVIPSLDKIAKVENEIYLYRVRKNSLLHTCEASKYYAAFEGFERVNQYLQKIDNDATKVYFSLGRARFTLALLRRAARQLDYEEYRKFSAIIPYEEYAKCASSMPFKFKITGQVYVFSKKLFYYLMRLI